MAVLTPIGEFEEFDAAVLAFGELVAAEEAAILLCGLLRAGENVVGRLFVHQEGSALGAPRFGSRLRFVMALSFRGNERAESRTGSRVSLGRFRGTSRCAV